MLIERPAAIRFGCGLTGTVGAYGCQRFLVVADGFNDRHVALLDLPGTPTVFGTVRLEPDFPNPDARLAT